LKLQNVCIIIQKEAQKAPDSKVRLKKLINNKKLPLTEGPIFGRMTLFALPIMLTGILQILYTMADNIIVGQFSGDTNALGAVGSTSTLNSLILTLLLGISIGTSVVVAQAYGAKNEKVVSRAVHTALSFSLIGGIVFMIAGLLVSRPALVLMGTRPVLLDGAVLYFRIICLGIPASAVYNFAAGILRSIGDSRTPLIILASTGLVNVVLNLFFVYQKRLRNLRFLVELHALADLLMYILHHLKAAAVLQGCSEQRFKGLFLLYCTLGCLHIEQRLDERLMVFLRAVRIEQRIVDIGCAVIKGRKHKAHFRRRRHIGGTAVMEFLFICHIAQIWLGQFYGAHRAEHISKGLAGCILLQLIILTFKRHIIAVTAKQYQIIFIEGNIVDDFSIQRKAQILILESAAAQIHQKLMLRRIRHLPGTEGNIDQILTNRAA